MKLLKFTEYLDVSPAFLGFFCAYFYFDPAQTFWAFFLSAALHEAGHLIALRCMRVRIHKLRLGLTGAVLYTPPLAYGRELLAAAAGPAVNAVCTLAFLHAWPRFALVNLLLLFYNLLPLYPLDGGRILRAALHLLLPDNAAVLVEKILAAVVLAAITAAACCLTCVWHAGLWPVILCALLLLRVTGTVFPPRRSCKSSHRANLQK